MPTATLLPSKLTCPNCKGTVKPKTDPKGCKCGFIKVEAIDGERVVSEGTHKYWTGIKTK